MESVDPPECGLEFDTVLADEDHTLVLDAEEVGAEVRFEGEGGGSMFRLDALEPPARLAVFRVTEIGSKEDRFWLELFLAKEAEPLVVVALTSRGRSCRESRFDVEGLKVSSSEELS